MNIVTPIVTPPPSDPQEAPISMTPRRLTRSSSLSISVPPPEDRSDEQMVAFFEENQREMQSEIGKALDEVVTRKYGGHPVAVIGQKLLESKGVDVSPIKFHVHLTGDGADQPTDPDKAVLGALHSARETVQRTPRSPSPTASLPSSDEDETQWNMSRWLRSLSFEDVIQEALSAPLHGMHMSETSPSDKASLEHAFIKELGQLDSPEAILLMMQTREHDVLDEIANLIYASARKMTHADGDTDGLVGPAGTTSKYFEDGDDSLKFGELKTFYEGLDGFIGPPNPNLAEAMQNEHCIFEDARKIFRVPNYYTHTTSEVEYWFVADASPKKLEELRREGALEVLNISDWPTEQRFTSSTLDTSQPSEVLGSRSAKRFPQSLSDFESDLNERNALLKEKSLEPIVEAELIGARLYTGPMYCKYNTVLRDIGELSMGKHSGDELSQMLKELQQKNEAKAKEKDRKNAHARHSLARNGSGTFQGIPAHDERSQVTISGNTFGNLYTTTLHVINSAVLKMGKLARADKIFRGISKKTMPQSMRSRNTDSGTRGGIEFGFLSCSVRRSEAEKYALSGEDDDRTPVLLEIQQGLIDRGADLAWLSQYPHEAEVLFPPLTGLEFIRYEIEGARLVVEVRPSVNLHSLTIEKVVAKMKRSHVQLLDLLTEGLRFAGVPTLALQPLTNLQAKADSLDATWFNSTGNYRDMTTKALDMQSKVFTSLVSSSDDLVNHVHGDDFTQKMDADKMMATAELAARAGEQKVAVELLLLRHRKKEDHAHETTAQALEHIARDLLDRGCKEPWPTTLVALANQEKFGLKDDVLPPAKFRELVVEALEKPEAGLSPTVAGRRPFVKGTKVLVCKLKEYSWTNARVRSVGQAGDEGMKGSEDYAKEPIEYSGLMYVVEGHLGGGKTESVHEEQVISPTNHGVPAVLCAAAERGEDVLVQELLEAKVNVYATDKNYSSALIRIADQPVEKLTDGHYKSISLLRQTFPKNFYELRNKNRKNVFDLATRNKLARALMLMQPELYPSTKEFGDDSGGDGATDVEKFRGGALWAHDAKWDSGVTTLMLTIRYGNPKTRLDDVKALIDAEADVNAKATSKQSTALHVAVTAGLRSSGRTDADGGMMSDDKDVAGVVELLLTSKADPNQKDDDLRTPLLQAAQAGYFEGAQKLIEHGADAFYNRKSRTILTYATQYGYFNIVKLLLEHADKAGRKAELLNYKNNRDESALAFAARYGHTNTCKMLLHAGIDVASELEKPYWTSLHRACANGHFDTAQLLLRLEPRLLNHKDVRNVTALMAAAKSGYTETVDMLASEDAVELFVTNNTNKKDKKGNDKEWYPLNQNALWLAAANGHADVVKVLITKYERKNKAKIGEIAITLHGQGEDPSKKADQVPATALMAAAHYGHQPVVRALYNAYPDSVSTESMARSRLDTAKEAVSYIPGVSASAPSSAPVADAPKKDDALILAVKQGHLDVVRAAVAWPKARGRLGDAEKVATDMMDKARQCGDTEAEDLYAKIAEQLRGPRRIQRKATQELLSRNKRAEERKSADEAQLTNLCERIKTSDLKSLSWNAQKNAFDGRLVPPRPNPKELTNKVTPLGPLVVEGGIVLQGGPFGSVWLRVGCFKNVPWPTLGKYLKIYVQTCIEEERKKPRPGALYCVVSMRAMQAVDFAWLSSMGFRFHHYRAPGHGDTDEPPPTVASGALGAHMAEPPPSDQATAELVYYCWPADTPDMVPTYSTSIEGVTGLILSRDETKLLMVWERKSWSTPGGAVNAGESKVDALEREVMEEVQLKVDRGWNGMRYLGGWQQQCARDNLINDNFSVFVVRCETEYMKPDGIEIKEAHWLPWKPILEAWRAAGKPTDKKVKLPNFSAVVGMDLAADRNVVGLNVLRWLETYELGKGFCVELKTEQQGIKQVTKATFAADI